jgi:hypothetical protein
MAHSQEVGAADPEVAVTTAARILPAQPQLGGGDDAPGREQPSCATGLAPPPMGGTFQREDTQSR